MDELQVTARIKIEADKFKKFEATAKACMRVAREIDTGTLQYDWFLNENRTECVVRERYRDSEAALEHVANLGATIRKDLQEAEMSLEFYGEASAKLIEAAKGGNVTFYKIYQSI